MHRNKKTYALLFQLMLIGIISLTPRTGTAGTVAAGHGPSTKAAGEIKRVYGASPPATLLLYAIDPTLMIGLNVPLREREKPFIHPHVHTLPVVGGYFGQGNTPNLELLLKIRPQLVVSGRTNALQARLDARLRQMGIPVARFDLEQLADYPQIIRRLGRLLHRSQRAEQLAAYADRVLANIPPRTASIPAQLRPRVYYAQGPDGLRTDCHTSWHAELIELAGGYNVHRCQARDDFGMEQVSMEQVLMYRPDIILVREASAYHRITTAPAWRQVPAVRQGRVYRIPQVPFDWFDRPPSFMRILGLQWTASKLHPQRFRIDLPAETRQFYRLFLLVDISDRQVADLLESGEVRP
jgi:iron complex transport system substrate-binding protein